MQLDVIHEDQDILVVNKPADLVVNEAETVAGETLQGWFAKRLAEEAKNENWADLVPADFDDQYGSPEEIFEQRQGLVHRLDKDTSGAIILAKNPGALVNLLTQFKKREVEKKYRCLTHGKFRVDEGTISAPVGRAKKDRQKFAIESEGRPAITRYQVEQYFAGFKGSPTQIFSDDKRVSLYQGFSLVSCWPKTGRTHQIRVHLKHWQHPIVGDSKYVGKKRAKLDAAWCPRQFLHAAELTLKHPRTQETMTFQAPLTQDLEKVLALLS